MIGSDGKRWVRRPVDSVFNPQYTRKTFKHGGGWPKTIMDWIKMIMDQYLYSDILKNEILTRAELEVSLKWKCMQDNYLKDTARIVKKRFEDHNIDVMQLSARSSDRKTVADR